MKKHLNVVYKVISYVSGTSFAIALSLPVWVQWSIGRFLGRMHEIDALAADAMSARMAERSELFNAALNLDKISPRISHVLIVQVATALFIIFVLSLLLRNLKFPVFTTHIFFAFLIPAISYLVAASIPVEKGITLTFLQMNLLYSVANKKESYIIMVAVALVGMFICGLCNEYKSRRERDCNEK